MPNDLVSSNPAAFNFVSKCTAFARWGVIRLRTIIPPSAGNTFAISCKISDSVKLIVPAIRSVLVMTSISTPPFQNFLPPVHDEIGDILFPLERIHHVLIHRVTDNQMDIRASIALADPVNAG